MKQETLNHLFSITEQISEAYIAEAMPHSLRNAHKLPDGFGMQREEREMKTIKTSITRYIGTGFAAAAAIAVVIGGGVLIGHLKGENPGRIANSDTTATVTQTTAATTCSTSAATDTTAVTTELTTESTAPVSDEHYAHNLFGYPGVNYCMKDGELSLPELDNLTIDDGTYLYTTGENGALIRIADGREMFRPEESAKADFRFTSITPAGDGWYFVTAVAEPWDPDYQPRDSWWQPASTEQYCWWFHASSGQSERVAVPQSENNSRPVLNPIFIQTDPDGGAVYALRCHETPDIIRRIPVPGSGDARDYTVRMNGLKYGTSGFTPMPDGKVLYLDSGDTGPSHLSLMELDTADGSTRTLLNDVGLCSIYATKSHTVLALKENGKSLYQYLPASNRLITVAKIDYNAPQGFTFSYDSFTAVADDFAVIKGILKDDENNQYIISAMINLTDRTYKILE